MKRLATALAVIAATAFAVAPAALAKHHHLTKVQRWEHRFHFKLTKANALGDADKDGVSNVGECHNGTNPTSADSDHDGRHDGNEDQNHNGVEDANDAAATVTSFTAATDTAPAVLVITLADGSKVTGKVTADTKLHCRTATPVPTPTTATTRDHSDSADEQGDENSDDGDNRGHDGEHDNACTTAALTVGTVVHEAALQITSSGVAFTELELIT